MSKPDSPTLLVVDDDEVFRTRLAFTMRARGFEVREAASPDEAVRLAKEDSAEYAIVDLKMPGATGLQLVSELLSVDPTTRVLVLTGYGSIATAVEAIRLGAADYLTKPADAEQIVHALLKGHAPEGEVAQALVTVPSLARVEWEHIQRVLADTKGNISEAARVLGIHRRSLQRKLEKYPASR
jgi:two-component system response regulator RegA